VWAAMGRHLTFRSWDWFSRHQKQVTTHLLAVALVSTCFTVQPAVAQQTPTPEAQGYRGLGQESLYTGNFAALALSIDRFWSTTFKEFGVPYVSPGIVSLDLVRGTACGRHGPSSAALYCTLDLTIYLSPSFLAEKDAAVGDYAPIIVLAHEWGHHAQNLLQVDNPGGNTYELQADCLAGVYTHYAEDLGLLEPGDLLEALEISESAGDPILFPQDNPGAHGTYVDRRNAVMRGYLDELKGYNLQIGGNPTPTATRTRPVTPTLAPTLTSVDVEPTPTIESQVGDELLSHLPNVPSLDHADCFGIVDDGTLTFEQLLGRFSGVPDAETRLQTWAWQASAFRQFGCEGPPEGEAGWIDVSLHLFGDSLAAQEAVDYFAATRAEGGPLFPVEPPAIGDHAAALSGPASNGKEFTIYASQGPLLVRVTGVSPSGIPFINVLTVTQAVLAAQQGQPQLGPTPPVEAPLLSASSYLPTVPAVHHRDCFEVLTEGTYIYGDVADALEPTGLSPSQFDDLGWRDGAYRVFTCDEPPNGRATQIDVVIHQFQDDPSARQALPYFSDTYAPGANEMRSCDTAGLLVVCVTGRSLTGSPLSDVQFVLVQVAESTR
jgi:predicted metalloprotease